VRYSRLERKLVAGVLLLFLVPTLVAGAILLVLGRRGVFDDSPVALAAAVAIGFVTMMAYLGVVAHQMGRGLVGTVQEIQLGTELMATVNPDHRLAVETGDELQHLADEINRLATHLQAARTGLEREVAAATSALDLERAKLAAVLDAIADGIVVATHDGVVTLANRAAHELLGSGVRSLLGRQLHELLDRETLAHFVARLDPGATEREAFTVAVPGGGVLAAAMTPFSDAERRMIGVVLALRDVTAPARADEDRHRRVRELLQELRGRIASVRSLSEILLADDVRAGAGSLRLLEAMHDEALSLSAMVVGLADPDHLARPPWHFETLAVSDVVGMAIRRLGTERAGRVDVRHGLESLGAIGAEPGALSAAIAMLLATMLDWPPASADVSVAAQRRGGVVQLEIGRAGAGTIAEVEARLDVAAAGSGVGLSPREVVRRHAGEAWAFAGEGRIGFRVNVPAPARQAGARTADARLVGAGLRSGEVTEPIAGERPDFYDFSLLEQSDRHVAPDQREQRLADLDVVVFDTETTGLEPERGDRIVSLAGVRVRRGVVRAGETFDALVNPGRPIPDAVTRIHGITDAMVASAPPIDVVLPAFVAFAAGGVLVGHQVWFDLRCLGIETERLRLPPLGVTHAVLDTLALSEAVHGPLPGHGLDVVAARLGVTVRARHSALGDALATAEVFVRLLELLRRREIVTLGQALAVMRRPGAAARVTTP
jgi:DNA polymerase-3 subunit epsilon